MSGFRQGASYDGPRMDQSPINPPTLNHAGRGRDEPTRHDADAPAFSHRNYRLFFAGQLVSLIGTFLTQVATVWLVYHITHSAILLGVVGFAGQIPMFALAPFAGVWVDRWNRQRLLVATQSLSMIQSFGLAAVVAPRRRRKPTSTCRSHRHHSAGILPGPYQCL